MRTLCVSAFRLSLIIMGLLFILPSRLQAATSDTSVAESLLAQPTDSGWSLEAMMAAHRPTGDTARSVVKTEKNTSVHTAARRTLEARISKLIATQQTERHTIDQLTAELELLRQSPQDIPSAEFIRLQTALRESTTKADTLTNQVSSLKAGITERDEQLKALKAPDAALKNALAEKMAANEKAQHDLAKLRRALAEKDAALATFKQSLTKKEADATEILALQTKVHSLNEDVQIARTKVGTLEATLEQKQTELTELHSSEEARLAALEKELESRQQDGESLRRENESLSNALQQKTTDASTLKAALTAREDALHKASSGLADLREKMKQQDSSVLSSAADRQAYMAGVMMSSGLADRLASWKDAGINVNENSFRSGLSDGLRGSIRLKKAEGSRAQKAFTQAVQDAATVRVAAAQQQMQALAKGRTPLKSGDGIVWYRLHKGHTVPTGQPVTLSMTEQVAGGRIISRIPPLTLRDNDEMPAIVQDGLRLPGDGGEVVAYALARSVYGSLPLPPGVRPWTVMEYHLHGGKPAVG